MFDEAAKVYQDELDIKGYNFKLEYNPTVNTTKKKRARTRKNFVVQPPILKKC